jgi:hypothetical protein
MLLRSDPFRDFDRLADPRWGVRTPQMPMDASRQRDEIVVHFDHRVDRDSIDLTVQQDTLQVTATRS